MKRCPYCDGEIRENAIKCKHCGSMLDGHGADTLDKRITMPGEQPSQQYDTLDVSATQGQDATILARQYRIVKKIGEGGMGVVYLAEDMEMGNRSVAIKVLPPLLSRNVRAVENLRKEAILAITLNHLNIIRLYGFHSDGDIKFLVMEYIDGQTLEEKIIHSQRGRMSLEEIIPIAEQIAAALDYAHSQEPPVFHRDLKPSNIMIDKSSLVKLLDFGIAREMKDSYTRVTNQETSGTIPYMSPQQIKGEIPDSAMDIYSFGVTLYECMAGHTPFHTGDLKHQILTKCPPEIADIPEHANRALQAALAKNTSERPFTATALIQMLGGSQDVVAKVGETLQESERDRKRKEEQLFRTIKTAPTIQLCQRYLKQYPNGRYHQEVKNTLEHLHNRRKYKLRLATGIAILTVVLVVVGYLGISILIQKQPETKDSPTQEKEAATSGDIERKPIITDQGDTLRIKVKDPEPPQLCDPTKSILAKLHQPIDVKLYYAKEAAAKVDVVSYFFDDYFETVHDLLKEYVTASQGMIQLHVLDPEPYSQAEEEAIQHGLRKFPVTEEQNFFMGLVIETQYGTRKIIPFFSPDRQKFLEYDITSLIESATVREKKRLGILSSLPVMGDDVTGYMAEMMKRQGQQPKPPWAFIEQLRKEYEVEQVTTDIDEIKDIEILLVIHPKELPLKTLFAIDQFVLRGGRTVVCVDPHCFSDRPAQVTQVTTQMQHESGSELSALMRNWGLEMPVNTFAGDKNLASLATIRANEKPKKVIGYLNLVPEQECFATDNVITSELQQVRLLFSGVLREVVNSNDADQNISDFKLTPLITTSSRGNTFSISNRYELMYMDPNLLMEKFVDGSNPVAMGYLITGRLKSSFPGGIKITTNEVLEKPKDDEENTKLITGLKEAQEDCAVVVFADVDFISDTLAYQNSFFGKVVVGDNSNLLLNTIRSLIGSDHLIELSGSATDDRPRNFINEIYHRIADKYDQELNKIEEQLDSKIKPIKDELNNLVSEAKTDNDTGINGTAILSKKKVLEDKLYRIETPIRRVKRVRFEKRKQIRQLATKLQNFNIPGSLVDEVDITQLESMIVKVDQNSVQLKRKGGGIIDIVKETSQQRSGAKSHPTMDRPAKAPKFVTAPLIQGLEVSKIEYIDMNINDNPVMLKRLGDNFAILNKNKDEYPAKTSAVNKLILSCLDFMVVDFVSDNAKDHSGYEVTQESAQIVVKFLKADRTLLAGFMIGKIHRQQQGFFVRLLPGNNVYIAREIPTINKHMWHYVDRNLLSLNKEDIESITLASAQEEYKIVQQQDGSYQVQGGQHSGKRIKKMEGERIFQALCTLQFEDVIKSDTTDVEFDFSRKCICRMKDSTEYVCLISQIQKGIYIKIDSEFTDKTPVTKSSEVEPIEELKVKEAKLMAQEHALKFSQKHKGWIYQIPEEFGKYLIQKLQPGSPETVGLSTATVTFADVMKPILNTQPAVLDIIVGDEEAGGPVIHDQIKGSLIRRTWSNFEDVVSIMDLESSRILTLAVSKKEAVYMDLKGLPSESSYMDTLRNFISELQKSPSFEVEELGEQKIQGQTVIGFRAKIPKAEVTIWADHQTALPVRIEQVSGQMKVILKNIKFDVPMDESLFSMEVPDGYKLRQVEFDMSEVTEEDFIEGLRVRAELFDGEFPDSILEDYLKQSGAIVRKLEEQGLPNEEKTELGMKLSRYLLFIQFFKGQGQWHYEGSGVKLGDAETAIFWYQPKGAETYRVIYGDLSVKDVSAENLPK